MKNMFYMAICCVVFTACSKSIDIADPTLSVSLDPMRLKGDTFVYKVGDTTKFKIDGYADNITFYSGEPGSSYANINRSMEMGSIQLSFTSNAQYGSQSGTLSILATNKINFVEPINALNAKWIDITSRAKLSAGSGAVASGIIDVSDLLTGPKDSLFIAFKYVGKTGSAQRTWTITNLTLNNVLKDGRVVPIITLASELSYWSRFILHGSTASWSATATQLKITGGDSTSPNNSAWIVARPLYPSRLSPDVGVIIKALASALPKYTEGSQTYTGYNYEYKKAGLYQATIVGSNNSIDDTKNTVKQFTIKVLP